MRHKLTLLLGRRGAFIAGLFGIAWLLVLTGGLWWSLPPMPRISWQEVPGHSTSMVVSDDGRTLLIENGDGFRLRDLATGKELAALEWNPLELATRDSLIRLGDVRTFRLSPDGRKVAYVDFAERVRLWTPAV